LVDGLFAAAIFWSKASARERINNRPAVGRPVDVSVSFCAIPAAAVRTQNDFEQ
jgi:hypothetical protein